MHDNVWFRRYRERYAGVQLNVDVVPLCFDFVTREELEQREARGLHVLAVPDGVAMKPRDTPNDHTACFVRAVW